MTGASLYIGPKIQKLGSWETSGLDVELVVDFIDPNGGLDPDDWIGHVAHLHVAFDYPAYVIRGRDDGFFASPSAATLTALSAVFRGWQWPLRAGDVLRVYRAGDRELLAELPARFVGELVVGRREPRCGSST